MVKIPGLGVALLTVAMIYGLTRDLFSYRAAVIASGLAAVTFWPIFVGRLGLRAGTLPLVALVVMWGVWRVCYARKSHVSARRLPAVLTGLVLGFSAYTYTAWFAVFVAFGAFIAAVALLGRCTLRCRWPGLALIGLVRPDPGVPLSEVCLCGP